MTADRVSPAVDGDVFRRVLGHFCTGVTVVSGIDGDEPVGFTAGSFTSVSLDPPFILVCPGRTLASWPRIERSGAFAVNVLPYEAAEVCSRFATPGADKFDGVDWSSSSQTGSPLLAGTLAWLDCEIHVVHEVGDHYVAIGRVVDLDCAGEGDPLLFFRRQYGRFAP